MPIVAHQSLRRICQEVAVAAERLFGQIGSSPPAPGFDAVLLPGDPELRMRSQRIVDGIPLPQSTWDEIATLAAELGVST